MATAGNLVCASADFNLTISFGNIRATIDIIPEDENKRVRFNQQFTVTAKYTIGRPKVLPVPFDVVIMALAAGVGYERAEILEVSPLIPNLVDVKSDEEQTVVVTAVVIPAQTSDPGDPSPSGDEELDINFAIAMYQPEFGPVSTDVTYHTPANANIPNLRSVDFGDSKIISWDSPTDDQGNAEPVDVRISIRRGGVPNGLKNYFSRVIENIVVTHDLIRDILVDSGFAAPQTYEAVAVKFQIKREDGTFNVDDEEFGFGFPVRIERPDIPFPRDVTFGVADYRSETGGGQTLRRYQLQWDQPYWLGDPTVPDSGFENLHRGNERLIMLGYEWRYKIDDGEFTDWMGVDDIVTVVAFNGEVYESRIDRVRAYPFGNKAPLDDSIQRGTYTFQGRGRTNELTYGRIIEITDTTVM